MCSLHEKKRGQPINKGGPILLFAENTWEHPRGAVRGWSANRHMRALIAGKDWEQPEVVSGTDYAVCFADPRRGAFSNAVWKARRAIHPDGFDCIEKRTRS